MAVIDEIQSKHGRILIDDSAYAGVPGREQAKRAAATRRIAGQILVAATARSNREEQRNLT